MYTIHRESNTGQCNNIMKRKHHASTALECERKRARGESLGMRRVHRVEEKGVGRNEAHNDVVKQAEDLRLKRSEFHKQPKARIKLTDTIDDRYLIRVCKDNHTPTHHGYHNTLTAQASTIEAAKNTLPPTDMFCLETEECLT
eukprot:1380704-Amorphochlora_amoeboformis.AAC.1